MARIVCNFISRVLQRTVDITVVIPTITIPESMSYTGGLKHKDITFDPPKYPNYVGRPKYPVLYLLHGYGNNHAQWTAYTKAELYAEERNIALVIISGENKSYVNRGKNDDFFDFIEDELLDFICGTFPVSLRKEDTYLGGLSMGGFGSMIHGLSHPEKFAAVGVLSAGLAEIKPGEVNTLVPAKQIYDMLDKAKAENTPLPPFYMTIGELDDLEDAKRAVKLFEDAGAKVTWDQVPGYAHEWRFWDLEVERLMDWLPRTDDYAADGKRRI